MICQKPMSVNELDTKKGGVDLNRGGDKTISELSQQFDVHPNQITQWKTQLLDRMSTVFEGPGAADPPQVDIKTLHAKIGKVTTLTNAVRTLTAGCGS
jgi:transposase